jgi:hypothetical protein
VTYRTHVPAVASWRVSAGNREEDGSPAVLVEGITEDGAVAYAFTPDEATRVALALLHFANAALEPPPEL